MSAQVEAGAAVRAKVVARQGFLQVLRDAAEIAKKDLRVELRSKEILLTMGYFGFLVVLIFSFSFYSNDAPISAVASGILWVSVAFSGTLGLGRILEREKEGDCIRALLLSPVSRPAIYLGKTFGVLAFMVVVELVVVAVQAVLLVIIVVKPVSMELEDQQLLVLVQVVQVVLVIMEMAMVVQVHQVQQEKQVLMRQHLVHKT